jgi:hypothetical protein
MAWCFTQDRQLVNCDYIICIHVHEVVHRWQLTAKVDDDSTLRLATFETESEARKALWDLVTWMSTLQTPVYRIAAASEARPKPALAVVGVKEGDA